MRYKIEIDRSILEKFKQFNFFGWEMSLGGEPDFDKKYTDSKQYAALENI